MKCGQKTEVYKRIVGYCRPVDHANAGKREEMRLRKAYDLNKAVAKCDDEKKSLLTAES
jgi:hypothetical protein